MVRSSANKCPPVIPAYYKSLTWPNQPCAGDDDGFDDDEGEDELVILLNSMTLCHLKEYAVTILVIFIITLPNRNTLHGR